MNDSTDEQYVDTIRTWWRQYGPTLVLTLTLTAAGYFGWQFWESQKAEEVAGAAELYWDIHQVLEEAERRRADPPSDDEELEPIEPATATAEQLKEQYPESMYATFAALYLAYTYVAADDLPAAIIELQWALQHTQLAHLRDLARIRLARLYLATEDHQGAQTLLAELEIPDVTFQAKELRGDAFFVAGDYDAAATAYRAAVAQSLTEDEPLDYLQWKLHGLPAVDQTGSEEEPDEANDSTDSEEGLGEMNDQASSEEEPDEANDSTDSEEDLGEMNDQASSEEESGESNQNEIEMAPQNKDVK